MALATFLVRDTQKAERFELIETDLLQPFHDIKPGQQT
jgi:hypothetical protein